MRQESKKLSEQFDKGLQEMRRQADEIKEQNMRAQKDFKIVRNRQGQSVKRYRQSDSFDKKQEDDIVESFSNSIKP